MKCLFRFQAHRRQELRSRFAGFVEEVECGHTFAVLKSCVVHGLLMVFDAIRGCFGVSVFAGSFQSETASKWINHSLRDL
jgi:hypothetical protein